MSGGGEIQSRTVPSITKTYALVSIKKTCLEMESTIVNKQESGCRGLPAAIIGSPDGRFPPPKHMVHDSFKQMHQSVCDNSRYPL